MKKILTVLFLSCSLFAVAEEYDVAKVYRAASVDSEAKILDSYGNLKEVETLLIPTDLETGAYSISVTRKAQNLYKVDGKNIYIETKYCYEYCYSEEVVLVIKSNSGYTIGKIIFE